MRNDRSRWMKAFAAASMLVACSAEVAPKDDLPVADEPAASSAPPRPPTKSDASAPRAPASAPLPGEGGAPPSDASGGGADDDRGSGSSGSNGSSGANGCTVAVVCAAGRCFCGAGPKQLETCDPSTSTGATACAVMCRFCY